MKYATKYFGEVEIPDEKILKFAGTIYGFEDLSEYFLVNFEPDEDSMLCLQSAQRPELAFILFNPYCIMPSYQPKMSDEDFAAIKAKINDKLLVYVIAVIKENGEVTVNLKSPIAINPENNLAAQLIIDGNEYSMRYIVMREGQEKLC